MSVFFDHQIHSNFAGEKYTDFAWHKNYGLLAVAGGSQAGGQTVAIFQQEGECSPDSIQRKTQPATTLAWHPVKKILAVGWKTGEITIRNEHDNEIHEPQHLHKSPIIVMHWSSNGNQLISGEVEGILILWKVDGKGRLNQNVLLQENIQEQPTFLVLLNPPTVDPAFDIKSLARAAVSGDETALDMFSWKRGGSKITLTSMGPQEALTYFVGGAKGGVFYLDEKPKAEKKFVVEGSVRKLLFHEERNLLVTLSTSMMVTLTSVVQDTRDTKMLMNVKINGRPSTTDMIWVGRGLLATCTGERYVRMWDVDKDENYILQVNEGPSTNPAGIISSISFSSKGILACGAENGKVLQWKFAPLLGDRKNRAEPEDDWQLQNVSIVSGTILDVGFGSGKNLLAVNTSEAVYILHEQEPAAHCCREFAVVQTGSMQLSIDNYETKEHFTLNTDIQIKELSCNKVFLSKRPLISMDALAIANGKKVVVYDVTGGPSSSHVVGSFSSDTHLLCMYEQNLYTLEPGKVQVRNFQGTVKQLLAFPNPDDELVSMFVTSSFLVIASNTTQVKVFDLSRREAKNHSGPKQFSGIISDLQTIISAKCNCTGSKVSLIISKSDGTTDGRLHVWDTETNSMQYFNFNTGRDDADEIGGSLDSGRDQSSREVRGRIPTSHHWDPEDPKLLVCEAKFVPTKTGRVDDERKNVGNEGENVDVMVVSLFVTSDHGILVHDNFPLDDSNCTRLVSLDMPYYYFTRGKNAVTHSLSSHSMTSSKQQQQQQQQQQHQKQQQQQQHQMFFIEDDSSSCRRIHRNFVGLERTDRDGREAMMNFSFHLTLGDMDEAFKAIKLIKNESVWENMAKMCVKTRRLDVARVCLGNMRDARGAKLLREAVEKRPEEDARVAQLAIILGLYDDAERLLKNCKRYDLLNEFYQNCGDWDKALGVSELHDRINLRRTNYNFAKFLEAGSNLEQAIEHYKKSRTHVFEIPRMFLRSNVDSLKEFIDSSDDEAMYRWWAQYQEGIGEMEEAIVYYGKAHDSFSLTRLYCALDQLDNAAKVCEESKDRAACYHIGRKYEGMGRIQEAIGYFNKAQALGNAIRLCKDGKFDDKLLNMAIKGNADDMLEAARYCEQRPGFEEKAALLYHKAGYSSKALELAFEKKQFAALQVISESFDETTDPLLLQRCAEFFVENSHFDRAVSLLASAKKHLEALRICKDRHVPMTDDLVEKLSPLDKELNFSAEEKNEILETIGDVCMDQRQYHLATKKFTQAGNRIKAMKALLKSGDTEKIILFANVSRQKEIYVMAGHYLQTLDWQKDPETMKNIIKFYTKGQALGHLAGFYESCAELEIDRYQDYGKAMGALGEACKLLMNDMKTKGDDERSQRLNGLKERMTVIHRFLEAKNLNNAESIKICQSLLAEPDCDNAVRIGDIFGFMTRFFVESGKWKMAYGCIEELQKRMSEIDVAHYIGTDTLKSVHSALNLEFVDPRQSHSGNNSIGNDGEEVLDEDIRFDD